MIKTQELLDKLGYKAKNAELFKQALTHSSVGAGYSYERIEFLGDAVLQLLSSERLYKLMPDANEGTLSRTRAAHVSEAPLSSWARSIDLGDYIVFGKSELSNGGRDKDSILADVAEALIGATYLDRGLEAARVLVERIFAYEDEHELLRDYKTELQELIQADGEHRICYEVIDSKGPAHKPTFTVLLKVDGKKLATGTGGSKKHAEQQAARMAFKKMVSKN